MAQETVIRFDNVTFEYENHRRTLQESSFSIPAGMKFTIMGQNGAGKTTLFKLITGELKPMLGKVHIDTGSTIAIATQTMDKKYMTKTLREFFEAQFDEKIYDIDRKIATALEAVDFSAPYDKTIENFSGGQQARLLLAAALIQNPDILLLDEPTNNLDAAGIGHLIGFLMSYEKTVLVISHDADFLNLFTDGVLYLDVHTKSVQKFMGDYYTVVEEIEAQRKKDEMKNARLLKEIQDKREQANTFAHKGGKLRLVAKKMREDADEAESAMVSVRKEDKTIREFTIPFQKGVVGEILSLSSVTIMKNHQIEEKKVQVDLRRNEHLLIKGPNGIGKTTLLESLASKKLPGMVLNPQVKIGYYRQDFSTLDFSKTVHQTLIDSIEEFEGESMEEYMRSIASGFLLDKHIMASEVGNLSEGQKGLVAFCQLVLQKPGLLILDEPTNHINFRHIPVIAKALHEYEGAMIVISHVDEFVHQIRIDKELDLGK